MEVEQMAKEVGGAGRAEEPAAVAPQAEAHTEAHAEAEAAVATMAEAEARVDSRTPSGVACRTSRTPWLARG